VAKAAVPVTAANLERLLLRRRPAKLVDHALELFGSDLWQVTEPVARRAIKYLHGEGKAPSSGIGEKRTKNWSSTRRPAPHRPPVPMFQAAPVVAGNTSKVRRNPSASRSRQALNSLY
jgi:hypothetical protein